MVALSLVAATMGFVGSAPAGAGIPGYASVSLVNAYSYAGGHSFGAPSA